MNNSLQEFKYEDLNVLFVVLVVLLVIDLPMIFLINNDMYMNQLKKINKDDKINSSRSLIFALLTYLLLVLGIYYFAVRQKNVYNGMFLGLVIYGVYNYTNVSTIANYGVKEAIIDTTWGTILCGLVTYIVLEFTNTPLHVAHVNEILTTTEVPSN